MIFMFQSRKNLCILVLFVDPHLKTSSDPYPLVIEINPLKSAAPAEKTKGIQKVLLRITFVESAFLHNANILLDSSYNTKLLDFGSAIFSTTGIGFEKYF